MANISLKTSIDIKAPAAKVWKALTDAEIVKQYFFGTDQKSDWKTGSDITWTGEWEGKTYQDHGKILEITPGTYVKYSYWSSMSGTEDKPENYQNVSYKLTEKDGVTILEIGQDNIKTEDAKQHSEQNWQHIFGAMRDMVESGKAD
ncbi:SRPBCC domain-containing protein [Mucilaginibacter corticis]|uniref:SRPBCC domain-containing protein n=1 Tax=Mucilaginibacter corticis TaxID=2597670 RepID=A0A556MHW9_9SPHI|nr:SRPBCC domain-containing protein [Mucilaginibacter corticis]TSJ39506.1 SRPBCC domain-containing protein [Mucilaginibacter corticis]